jgi:hypothetical protein
MLKTISAALLAVSVLAAPAFAAGTDKTQAPVTKSVQTKASVLKANAKMGRHQVRHASHHRFHKRMALHKTGHKIATKHVMPAKRG